MVRANKKEIRNWVYWFPVPKKDSAKVRLTTDFRSMNKALAKPPQLKLTRPKDVGSHLFRGAWLCRLDLSDAYNHLRLKFRTARHAGFVNPINGVHYIQEGLGFGLAFAPAVFVRTIRAALQHLRNRGIRLIDYLDDILVIARDAAEARRHTEECIAHLQNLGFTINLEKSETTPTQRIQYLGFMWDTTTEEMSVPEKKAAAVRKHLLKLLRRRAWQVQEIMKVYGKLMALLPAVNLATMHTRNLQMWLKGKKDRLSKHAATKGGRKDLSWWTEELQAPVPTTWSLMSHQTPLEEIYTDASDYGWGAYNKTRREKYRGFFSMERTVGWRIEKKEIFAASQALLRWIPLVPPHSRLNLHIDSSVAVSYVNRLRGGRVKSLTAALRRAHQLARKKNITVLANWISTKQNRVADALSRVKKDHHDYRLNPEIMHAFLEWLDLPPIWVDLCATEMNRQCKRYVSRWKENKSWRWDFLSLRQKDFPPGSVLWCNPPWKMIPKALQWASTIKHRHLVMVTPYWKKSSWQPLRRELTLQEWIVNQEGCYIDCCGRSMPMPRWNTCLSYIYNRK